MSFVCVGDIAEQVRGVTYAKPDATKEALDGTIPLLRANNIEEGGISVDDLIYVRSTCASEKQMLRPGDIVVVASSGSLSVVGKAAQLDAPFKGTFGAFCKVVRPSKRVHDRYLGHFFRTPHYRRKISSLATGANINNLKSEHLNDLRIPLPSLDEQRRIAVILDQADALRRKRREALAGLARLERAMFVQMFGDALRNDRCWPRKAIGALGRVITGNTPSRADKGNYGSEIEWIKSDNLNNDEYYATEASERLSEKGRSIGRVAPKGAILITCIAGSPDCIGNAAMLDREAAFNQQINAFVPIFGNPHFLYSQIRLFKKLVQMASTNSMKGMVNKSRFEKIELIFPPIELQNEFSGKIGHLRRAEMDQSLSATHLDTLFASLQHRAFRGEL